MMQASSRNLKKVVVPVLVGIVLLFIVLLLTAQPAPEHPFFAQAGQRPLVIAHRGGIGLWPEETMYAFSHAVELGVDVLEMDVYSSSDGVLVLMHNETVNATTNGSGVVHDLTLEELKALDAGYYWTDDGGQSFPFRGQGIQVATLDEVFTAFPDMLFNIEIKQFNPPIAQPLCTLIRAHGLQDRVLVASFFPQVMQEFRQACPEVAVSGSENEIQLFFAASKLFLHSAFTPSSHAYQVPEYHDNIHLVTAGFVHAAHNRNVEVHVWTVNDKEDMQRLARLGVDGIITDYPDRLLEVLGRGE
jgi:glycerophosphoryl diester phosphodiesterase